MRLWLRSKEVCGSDGSLMVFEQGEIKQKESSLTTVFKTEQGENAPKLLSNNSIARPEGESKGMEEEIRYQLENGAKDADKAGWMCVKKQPGYGRPLWMPAPVPTLTPEIRPKR